MPRASRTPCAPPRATVALVTVVTLVALAPAARPLRAQEPPERAAPRPPAPRGDRSAVRHWSHFALGAAASVLLHEAGHVGASYAAGARPSFGFDKGRPTIYSGIDAQAEPRKQFVFSSAGLTVQSVLDEIILDVPHAKGSAFERGVLAGGLGTTAFYITLGRNASVSDVTYMARTSSLSKTEVSLIYGGVAAVHALRIWRDERYGRLFARPDGEGRLRVGVDLRTR